MQLVDVQIKECEGFLSRPRAHLTCEADHSVRDAEHRLEALKQMQQFSPPPPVDREIVAQMKGQLEVPKPAMVEGQVSKRICRREDYVPNCRSGLQEDRPISTRQCWWGDQTKSRGSATSCVRPHNSGNEKSQLECFHPW